MRSPAQIDENDNPPIVILGGGFAGLFAALHLRDLHSGLIILIDQSWNFVFKPLLYELLSSEVKLELICPRYDALLHNSRITFVLGTVEAIDLDQKQVKLDSGLKYSYRHLVLALGSTTSYLGIPGAKEHALSFRTAYDTFALGQHLRNPLGGNPQEIRIVILQRGSEILKESKSDRLRKTAQSALQERTASVNILLGSEVKAVHPGTVEFERNGQRWRLAAATVIDSLPIPAENRDEHNRLLVKPTLQLPEFPEVFGAGDCAIDPSNPQPATAQVAYQQGAAIAHNIKALIAGKSPTPATVNLRGTLMKLGLHQSAVEIFDRYEVKGQLGQAIRLATYLELMPTPARNFVNRTGCFTEEILKQIVGV